MTRSRGMIFAASASALGLAIACNGSISTTSSSPAAACDRLFNLVYVACAQVALPPAAEVARRRQRFQQPCEKLLTSPGVTLNGDALNACLNAFEAAGCGGNGSSPPECNKPGTLASGASCASNLQCQSLSCPIGATTNANGGSSRCGSCAAVIAVGQPCGAAQGSCASGSHCDSTSNTCATDVVGDVGAVCISETNCKAGLHCDFTTRKCAAAGAMGAQCFGGSTDCMAPLVCGVTGTCQSPSAAGGPCRMDTECASGLVCDPTTNQCGTPVWASGGQACGGPVRCLVGSCSSSSVVRGAPSGLCPTVLADGATCGSDPSKTCDALSSCTSGTCILSVANSCP